MNNQLVIDLHYLTEKEAVSKILFALWQIEEDKNVEKAVFITGQGNVLRDLTIELIEEQGFNWTFDGNNHGAIIVSLI